MIIVIRRYDRKEDFSPDYKIMEEVAVHGKTAAECMSRITSLRDHNDLNKHTPWEITDVQD